MKHLGWVSWLFMAGVMLWLAMYDEHAARATIIAILVVELKGGPKR